MALLDQFDHRRERRENDRENRGRLAFSYAVVDTDGQGSIRPTRRVPFDVTFLEKPFCSYAAECDLDDLAAALDVDDEDGISLPNCSGYVVAWDQDDRDFYVGCWVAIRVVFPLSDAVSVTASTAVSHHFTFSGIGMKDVLVDYSDLVD